MNCIRGNYYIVWFVTSPIFFFNFMNWVGFLKALNSFSIMYHLLSICISIIYQ